MVDYNNFAKTFSKSRQNMKWEEIDYFLEKYLTPLFIKEKLGGILDIGCGSGRFLGSLKNKFPEIKKENYIGVDLSSLLLEEAGKVHVNFKESFFELNMLEIDKILKISPILKKITGKKMKEEGLFNNIFFIASFHHLDNLKDREEVISKSYNLLKKGGKIFMTNWALNSELNYEKYIKSIISKKNNFNSSDYSIKIGNNTRYYHCFNLTELKYLAEKTKFKIIENRLFDNQRNFITILEK